MELAFVLSASPDSFSGWLDRELFLRFGRAASNRSICIKAGLPENALYRVLTKGERPSAIFCERMAAYLGLQPEELERRGGLRPTLEISAGGAVTGVEALSQDERRTLRGVLEPASKALRQDTAR